MTFQEHTTPEKLERYSFLWSEARLVIASVALFLGGVPPVMALNPIPAFYNLISSLLTLCWIVSGVAAGYLLYRWHTGGKTLFHEKRQHDTIAFFVMVVSGLNLGLAGLISTNIGMSISSNRLILTIVGALYLIAAYYLHKRWHASGQKMF